MIRSASSNSAGFDRWVISPVWIMNAGRAGKVLIFPDCLLERADGVGVGWFVKADMAVADLKETQLASAGAIATRLIAIGFHAHSPCSPHQATRT
jgi:hypothetical protein